MRVFVAGASGAIGRRLLPLLRDAGHDVTGTTRSKQRAEAIRAAGARAVVCDAFDAEALRAAAEQARPDVVVHELTALPERLDPRKASTYEPTNLLRREGTRNLLAAARAAGARRFVCQSVAFAYAPGSPGEVEDEDAPLFLDAPSHFGEGIEAIAGMERAELQAEGLRRRFQIVGRGTGLFSFIHVDDAAAATAAAVERGAPGVYNVVDDDPAPVREWVPAYAEAIGAKPPRRIPVWLARLFVGRAATALDTQPGASNDRIKRELGWEPRWPSWREGFREAPR